jgi:hypothetical protein
VQWTHSCLFVPLLILEIGDRKYLWVNLLPDAGPSRLGGVRLPAPGLARMHCGGTVGNLASKKRVEVLFNLRCTGLRAGTDKGNFCPGGQDVVSGLGAIACLRRANAGRHTERATARAARGPALARGKPGRGRHARRTGLGRSAPGRRRGHAAIPRIAAPPRARAASRGPADDPAPGIPAAGRGGRG